MRLSPSPLVSVVIVITGDTVTGACGSRSLSGTLEALAQQDAPLPEIIVPYHCRIDGIAELAAQYPGVRFLDTEPLKHYTPSGGSRSHHDEMRARGMIAASGEIIAFLEDHVRPASDWSAQIVRAHQQPSAGVGGAIDNAIDRPLNWAAYFLDLGKYQSPLRAGDSLFASLVNTSYKSAALYEIRQIWHESFNETQVNAALLARGEKLALDPSVRALQYREPLGFDTAWREFFTWGSSYADIRSRSLLTSRRMLYALLAPLLPFVLTARAARRVFARRRNRAAFARAFPFVLLLSASWSIGELVGYVAPSPATPLSHLEQNA